MKTKVTAMPLRKARQCRLLQQLDRVLCSLMVRRQAKLPKLTQRRSLWQLDRVLRGLMTKRQKELLTLAALFGVS